MVKVVTWVFFILFIASGIVVVVFDADQAAFLKLRPYQTFIYGFHIFQWMTLGMAANYLWEYYNSNASWTGLTFAGMALPLIISPLIFYSVWAMWKDRQISFVLDLVAFQNGFFWQVIFSNLSRQSRPVQQNPPLPNPRPPGTQT